MTPEQYEQVKAVFQAALDHNPDSRADFLVGACNGDEMLLRETTSLLEFHDRADSFIEKSAFTIGAQQLLKRDVEESFVGQRIGQYELTGQLGYGGMGAVYLAARADEQFKKLVAIKIVKRELDTEETRRRFRHERQILASLDHPNIARLLDGGTTGDGLPYLVMEYVEGKPVGEYCKEHRLPTIGRLNLFRKICSAVHYAHQRLVIHRDIKPGNILVTEDGTPKLLDFGIAKLLDPQIADLSQTATEVRLMTPEYASPEQVRGEEITTATDVYLLGVLLYELLTGHRPYRVTSGRPDEIARAICEQDPERPSTAISRIEEPGKRIGATRVTPESVSRERGDEPAALRKRLSGDLDNIVLKAMQKAPSRRYSSVEEFSEDVRRHLTGLPVIARPDTISYRTVKFVRRNRAAVAAGVVVSLALIAGLVATIWQGRVAAKERDIARIERAKAVRVNSFLQEMLSSADPSKKGVNVKAADLLTDAARRADIDLAGQPEIQAEVRRTIGNTFGGLNLFAQGEPLLRQALATHRQLYGSDHRETATTMYDLARLLRAKGEFDEAETTLRQVLDIKSRLAPNGDVETAATLIELSALLFQKGKGEEMEAVARQALDLSRRVPGAEVHAATALNLLGMVQEYRGNLSGAESFLRQSIDAFELVNPPQAIEALVLMNLATNLTSQGKYDEADALFQRAIERSNQLFGPNHPNSGIVLTHYGRMYYLKKDYVKSEELLRRAMDAQQRAWPIGHPETAQTLATLGIVLARGGKAEEGERYLRDALKIRQEGLPKGHWSTANVMSMLGEVLMIEKRYAEAQPLLMQGYEEMKKALGEKHPRTLEASARLVQFFEATHKPAEAAKYR